MTELSSRARHELMGVHPALVAVVERAWEIMGNAASEYEIWDGSRTYTEQLDNVRRGVSKTMNSRHLIQKDGMAYAVDIVPLVNGHPTWPNNAGPWKTIAHAMHQAGKELGVPVENGFEMWGWDRPHWQIPFGFVWERAPGKKKRARKAKGFTPELIAKLAPHGNPDITRDLPALLNKYLPKYDINTPKRIAMFMANIMTETGPFRTLEENLNYSAKRMMQVWPKYFPSLRSARPYAHNPEKLANHVYNRWGNKGHKGWGWKYRGRGFMQTTFVNNYRSVQKVTGMPVVSNPDLLLDPEQGLIAACIYWKQTDCNKWADKGDVARVRKIVNGGTHGLHVVENHYRTVLALVKDFDLTKVTEPQRPTQEPSRSLWELILGLLKAVFGK